MFQIEFDYKSCESKLTFHESGIGIVRHFSVLAIIVRWIHADFPEEWLTRVSQSHQEALLVHSPAPSPL